MKKFDIIVFVFVMIIVCMSFGCANKKSNLSSNTTQSKTYLSTKLEESEWSGWPGVSIDEYDRQCPYGDVVIVRKGDEGLPKANLLYDCVWYNEKDDEIYIKSYDYYTKTYYTSNVDRSKYRVFVMDGELVVKNRKAAIIEDDGSSIRD